MPRSRKYGSKHPLPHKPSWHSVYLVKHRDNIKESRYYKLYPGYLRGDEVA
jgi:predicted metallopeptidase